MQKSLFTLLLTLLVNVISAQSTSLNKLQIEEDIDIFIAALEEAHPGLNIHISQNKIDSLFENIRGYGDDYTLKSFYTSLLKTIVSIGDGHTDLYEGKWYRETYPYLENTLPFDFYILNQGVYISKSYDNSIGISNFSEIISINGKPIEEVLEIIYSHTPADGNNIEFKRAYNEKILSRQIAKFFESPKEYELEVKSPEGFLKIIKVEGVHDSILHEKKYNKTPLTFEQNEIENYALLTVNTFQYRLIMEADINYHNFLDQSFKELRKSKIDNLIIDIRENVGGHNILAITLYSYLTQGKFKAMNPGLTKLFDTTSISRYSNFPNGEYPYLKTHDVDLKENGLYELKNGIDSKEYYDSDFIYIGPNKKLKNISKNKFEGTVYCLTSGLTFSAASNLSSMLSRNENVVFIGQETGGANGHSCGGGFYIVTLPNSKFVLQIPYARRCVAGFENTKGGQGVIPDYTIYEDIEHIRDGTDAELQKARELIKSKR